MSTDPEEYCGIRGSCPADSKDEHQTAGQAGMNTQESNIHNGQKGSKDAQQDSGTETAGPGMKHFFVGHVNSRPCSSSSVRQRIFTFTSTTDTLLIILGCICAIGAGVTQPLVALVFGSYIDKFTNFGSSHSASDQFRKDVNEFTYVSSSPLMLTRTWAEMTPDFGSFTYS